MKDLNIVDRIEMDLYTIYYIPNKGTNKTYVMCKPFNCVNMILIGEIYLDLENNISQSVQINDEAVCIIKDENGNKKIKKLFFIPKLTFIEGDNKLLEEYYNLLFNCTLNEQIEDKKLHITRHNIFR